MTTTPFRRSPVAVALAAMSIALAPGFVRGAGFALQEQNASGLGHAYAGGAAAAEDVSTIFYNPAGLVRLKSMQFVVAANAICPSTKFHDSGSSQAAFGQPLGGTGGDAGSCAGVPNLYFGVPFTDKWSFGIGVNVPFGLKTEYDSDWLGRFQAVQSKVETYNINPVLSWEPTKNLTVGAGVSYQHLKATLTSQVNYAGAYANGVQTAVAANPALAPFASTLAASAAGLESSGRVTGDDGSWGWNVGVLWQATPETRFGAAYRSHISYTVVGNASFDNPTAVATLPPQLAPTGALILNGVNAQLYDGSVQLKLRLPDTANVSIFHQFDNKWDLMADVQYTGWSSFKELNVVRTSGAASGDTLSNPPNTPTPENFRSTWRVSGGANYRYTDKWTWRGGIAWDQSPVNNTDRTPRLPDNDRFWLAFGAQYKLNDNWAFDAAYAYIWVRDASINQNAGNTAANGLINGTYKANVNIVGLQVTYTAK
ncbi:MAG TPA: outer membrane protein transport protein [Casimicrobiaceae bacterium]|jgi:long-chain fatty acid transport protein